MYFLKHFLNFLSKTSGFGSAPTSQQAGGSYGGSYGGSKPTGSQQNPGFAAKPTQQTYQPTQAATSGSYGSYGGAAQGGSPVTTTPTVAATQPAYRPVQSGSYGGVKPTATQPSYGGLSPTTSGAVDGQKYTGGFGGAPGVLGNQPSPGFAVKPTVAVAAVQPTHSSVPVVQANQPTQPTYQQGGADYAIGHLTNVNAPLASPPSVALLPPSSAGHFGGVTADHKIVFSDEPEPTHSYTGIYPIQPQLGQQGNGAGSYGKKPTGGVSTGGAAAGGSYGSTSGSYGSYGNNKVQPVAAGSQSSGANKPGKYTGSFGGAPGVLGEQKVKKINDNIINLVRTDSIFFVSQAPGFAVQPDGTVRDPTIAGATGVAVGFGASAASTSYNQQKSPAGSYNHAPAQDSAVAASSASSSSSSGSYGSYGSGKYTSGFGGPPGVLSPYDNVSGGKYHH
jgi:hypothetical protein